ncbi:MAG: hypothetical protein VKO21_05965 [Candidatus Sericytochromatia bacterium]|nr:hypothetical protein [Candidatus Sericytochromatia bacterium]
MAAMGTGPLGRAPRGTGQLGRPASAGSAAAAPRKAAPPTRSPSRKETGALAGDRVEVRSAKDSKPTTEAEALAQLKPAQRLQYERLKAYFPPAFPLPSLLGDRSSAPIGTADPHVTKDLERLLIKGKLTRPSASGTTALSEMVAFIDRDPGLHGPASAWVGPEDGFGPVPLKSKQPVLELLIGQLARPMRVKQGEGTMTCGATVVQSLLAHKKPGEYARLVTGLAVDGQVKTAGGDLMKADFSKANVQGRDAISDVVQESFMGLARKMEGRQVIPDDVQFGNGVSGRTVRRFGNLEGAGEGLGADEVVALVNTLINPAARAVGVEDRKPLARMALLDQELERGPVPVGIKVAPGVYHVVLVETKRSDPDRPDGPPVYMVRDPATGDRTSQKPAEFIQQLMFVSARATSDVAATPVPSGDYGNRTFQAVLKRG